MKIGIYEYVLNHERAQLGFDDKGFGGEKQVGQPVGGSQVGSEKQVGDES